MRIRRVLFGDSQSSGIKGVKGADTWVEKGLSLRGYQVRFVGAPGIGFVAETTQSANYPDAISTGQVVLPYGSPALVVLQGGGNDAARGATEVQIKANVERLLRQLRASYPSSDILMIGTLGRGLSIKSDPRAQVDAVLAEVARSNGIPFISPRDWITKYKVGNKMLDGVHLSASGHQELSQVLAAELTKLGLQAPAR
ncbi:SGNH/GDSL hydrolase family protein [Arthrobacter psychrolactophilus]